MKPEKPPKIRKKDLPARIHALDEDSEYMIGISFEVERDDVPEGGGVVLQFPTGKVKPPL